MLFGTSCAGCGRGGVSPCVDCVHALVPLGEVHVAGLERCLVLLQYDALSLSLITALKYRGVRAGVPWMSCALAQRVTCSGEQFHTVTWVPASKTNRRRRGFDQSKLLAEPLARRLGIRARRLLTRTDDRGQTGKSRTDRLEGPSLALAGRCGGETVLLVDDVVTTGTSMAAAAEVLRRAGAARVVGVAIAHRPLA